MQRYQYIILGLVAILALGGGALLLSMGGEKEEKPQENVQQEQVDNTNNSLGNLNKMVEGCDDQTAYQKDAKGRFIPTKDIANKVVTLETTMGNIKIALYDKDAPKTVQNFVCLTEKGYYNGIIFHRVSKGFVIQAGDPTGTGRGGGSIFGDKFEDELYSDTPSYKAGYQKGVVAMANAGPNTNSSQFFIMLATLDLPHNYTIFGKVVEGMDVVDKIGQVQITPQMGANDGKPVTDVVINKATVQ
jgi:cyclophilin family peptidyl-prolyl cis-trans isomerase